MLDQTSSELGAAIATSTDGRLVAFDLRPRREQLVERLGPAAVLEMGDRVLNPFPVRATGG